MTNATDWTGAVGDVWASEWRRTDRSFAGLAPLLNARAIAAATGMPSPRILDIGCGAGATSLALAAALRQAEVIGVDLSAGLTAIAGERSANLANVRFETGPVETVAKQFAPIDLFVSRHGVMFFPDPVVAFTAIRSAAAPGGRIVFSCFREPALNPWASEIVEAIVGESPPPQQGYAPGPFAFAEPDFVQSLLDAAGWHDASVTPVDYRFHAGVGADPVADATEFFCRVGPAAAVLRAAEPERRDAMLSRLNAVLERYRSGDVVSFPAAAWLWSAHSAPGEAQ